MLHFWRQIKDHPGIGGVHSGNVPVKTNANLFLFRNSNLLVKVTVIQPRLKNAGENNTYLSKPRELNSKGLSVILKDMVEIERPVLGQVSLFSDDRSSVINPVHHVNIRFVEEKRSNINSKQSLFPN